MSTTKNGTRRLRDISAKTRARERCARRPQNTRLRPCAQPDAVIPIDRQNLVAMPFADGGRATFCADRWGICAGRWRAPHMVILYWCQGKPVFRFEKTSIGTNTPGV